MNSLWKIFFTEGRRQTNWNIFSSGISDVLKSSQLRRVQGNNTSNNSSN